MEVFTDTSPSLGDIYSLLKKALEHFILPVMDGMTTGAYILIEI